MVRHRGRHRSPESLLDKRQMQQIDLAEYDASQRHTRYGSDAIRFTCPLVVNLFDAVRRMHQQMIAVLVVFDIAVPCEYVHQPCSISVNEQPEGLLLVISRNQMVFVSSLDQITRIPEMTGCCLTTSRR